MAEKQDHENDGKKKQFGGRAKLPSTADNHELSRGNVSLLYSGKIILEGPWGRGLSPFPKYHNP